MLEDADKERLISKYGRDESGAETTYVLGEKYPMRGNPKYLALMALRPIKSILNKLIVNRMADLIPFIVSNDKFSEPVREVARVFDLFIEADKLGGNKKDWIAWKKVICIFLEHDLPYRYRFQWILERINKDKIKLSDGDKYFFRVKNFRVDLEEEWKEVLNKYPQLKGQEKEFKQFLSEDKNWLQSAEDRTKTLTELAPKFLNK